MTSTTLRDLGPHYKWIALSNTTLGVLIATINASILLIALPDIFRGLQIDPLAPGNSSYLLWLIMGYLVVTAVLVVTFGRLGDMYGRVKMYNAGFAIFTVFSIALSVVWMTGTAGVVYLIVMRLLQGVGGALLMANSSAIITDAFPADQRGLALGLNMVAGIAGSFLGLVIGGVLAPIDWRLVFLVSVPFSLFGTVWGYRRLHDLSPRRHHVMDWWGNLTFAFGLIARPGRDHLRHPAVRRPHHGLDQPVGGGLDDRRPRPARDLLRDRDAGRAPDVPPRPVQDPGLHLGNIASLLAGLGRGGLMFILIIWLQGIWLPRHGYTFESTPLWAGIFMLPMTVGFLVAGPLSGWLSDRYGARWFATGGMLIAAATFFCVRRDCRSTSPTGCSPPPCSPTASGWACSPPPTGPRS